LIGLILKIRPVEMLQLGAPSACVTLFILKIQCRVTGCCIGRILTHQENGRPIRFPSQIVEMSVALILLFVMLRMLKSEKYKNDVYAWFLLLYGSTRFILNLLRDTQPFVLGLSAGCFWSIISILIGGGYLLYKYMKEKSQLKLTIE
ncbi:MAG: prolipoprotein diacylglyceryl transferase, partial [Clostridia bacterium]|nr:prolipoprotein diacylglyceryl transferase [Clostridia bacterium]